MAHVSKALICRFKDCVGFSYTYQSSEECSVSAMIQKDNNVE